jgi:hypothetical protein
MKWMQHKNLSENDLLLLAGTETVVKLVTNRLVIVYEPKETPASMKDLGLYETVGLYCVRRLQSDKRDDTIEILFELAEDREMVAQMLTQFKLGKD